MDTKGIKLADAFETGMFLVVLWGAFPRMLLNSIFCALFISSSTVGHFVAREGRAFQVVTLLACLTFIILHIAAIGCSIRRLMDLTIFKWSRNRRTA